MIHLRGIQYPSRHGSSADGGGGREHRGYQVKYSHLPPNFEHDLNLRVRPIAYIQGIDKFDLVQ
jgi:hypothetical protein